MRSPTLACVLILCGCGESGYHATTVNANATAPSPVTLDFEQRSNEANACRSLGLQPETPAWSNCMRAQSYRDSDDDSAAVNARGPYRFAPPPPVIRR